MNGKSQLVCHNLNTLRWIRQHGRIDLMPDLMKHITVEDANYNLQQRYQCSLKQYFNWAIPYAMKHHKITPLKQVQIELALLQQVLYYDQSYQPPVQYWELYKTIIWTLYPFKYDLVRNPVCNKYMLMTGWVTKFNFWDMNTVQRGMYQQVMNTIIYTFLCDMMVTRNNYIDANVVRMAENFILFLCLILHEYNKGHLLLKIIAANTRDDVLYGACAPHFQGLVMVMRLLKMPRIVSIDYNRLQQTTIPRQYVLFLQELGKKCVVIKASDLSSRNEIARELWWNKSQRRMRGMVDNSSICLTNLFTIKFTNFVKARICFYCQHKNMRLIKKKQWNKIVKSKQKLKKCKRCKRAQYCSRVCQKLHWRLIHSTQCCKLKIQ